MTVIVMIFLMALVVILIRNVDLVRQLRQTIALEQESAVQSDTLALRIATLSDEVAGLQLRLGETDAHRLRAEATAYERQQEISTLLGNIAGLEQIRERLTRENTGLASSRDALRTTVFSMEEKQQALERLGYELETKIAALALERDRLTGETSGLTEENSSLRQKLERSTLHGQQLTEAMATVGAEREQYRAKSVALSEKNLTLEAKLTELVSLKVLLEQRIESLGEEKAALQGEHAVLVEKNAGLSRKLTALIQFQAQLESQVNSLATALAKLEEDKSQLLEENRSTTAWLATLLELQQSLEKEKGMLKSMLAEAETQRTELQASRAALEQEVSSLIGHRLTLVQEKTNLVQRIDDLVQTQDVALQEQQEISEDLAGSRERYRLTKKELDYLVAKHADEIAAFEQEKALLVENLQALELLQGQYGDLEAAYNRLVKPARNMVGRHVVRVRYWKESGHIHYSVQEPGQESAVEMSENELHQRLSSLKVSHRGNLFTHVIFPGGKDISQEEAYLFERTIVSLYDYYESD
jgi:myosin heavy subunit